MLSVVFRYCSYKSIKMLPEVVFVLGGPGAGKGTQCSLISKHYDFVHLSAGDLLREERNRPGSEYGEMIEKKIRDGEIVPVEVTCSLIHKAMQKLQKKRFLVDGFPRNQDNLDGWQRTMADKAKVLFVLFFDCPSDVCINRCMSRGAAGSGRSDDNAESLQKRINTYMNHSMPIIEHYDKIGLVHRINAEKSPQDVFLIVQQVFKSHGLDKVID